MLKMFEASGFKNFENAVKIDFSDVHDYHFNDFCITKGLLSKIIVYGKNSSGKTNLGLALFDIVSHLTENNVTPGLYTQYINSESKTNQAFFHYVFDIEGDIVDYHYIKDKSRNLLREKLILNDKLLFEYDHKTKTGLFDELKLMAPTLNLEFEGINSILRYAINNISLSDSHPLKRMIKFVSSMLWFRSLDENRYIGYKSSASDYYEFMFKNNLLDEFQSFLRKAGIDDNLIAKTDASGEKKLYVKKRTLMPFFSVASSGTRALYNFFYWYKTCKDVSFMFIDEFDAYYHYELSEVIVKMLESMNHTQVILTSHNTNLLSNRIMRPDCYFILSGNKITSLVNATDRELREGHNLEKLYLSGEFDE